MSFQEAVRKCFKNWMIVGGSVGVLTGILIFFNTVKPVWTEFRPWTTREEAADIIARVDAETVKIVTLLNLKTHTLAERVYPRTVEDQTLQIAVIDERINWLLARYSSLTPKQHQELSDFRRQKIQANNELTRLSEERALFRLNQEHR
jgi:exonuclease I